MEEAGSNLGNCSEEMGLVEDVERIIWGENGINW